MNVAEIISRKISRNASNCWKQL